MLTCKRYDYLWSEDDSVVITKWAIDIKTKEIDMELRAGNVILLLFCLGKGVKLYFLLFDLDTTFEGIIVEALSWSIEKESLVLL